MIIQDIYYTTKKWLGHAAKICLLGAVGLGIYDGVRSEKKIEATVTAAPHTPTYSKFLPGRVVATDVGFFANEVSPLNLKFGKTAAINTLLQPGCKYLLTVNGAPEWSGRL